MNIRRLEAEAIRDALLAVSGRLDPTLVGPSVPPHLSAVHGRSGPAVAVGPLDGDGRRSLYVQRPPQLPHADVPGVRRPGAVLNDGPPQRLERPGAGP